jgi:hypothetical protein
LALPDVVPVFRSLRSRTPNRGPGVGSRSPPAENAWRPSGSPKFLENPHVPLPCSPTPAGPSRQALRRTRYSPRYVHNEGSHDYVLSGLNRTALALAVYASSGASRHATQDSLPAVGHFTGRDWLPAGFFRKVSDRCLPPFPSFLGARTFPNTQKSALDPPPNRRRHVFAARSSRPGIVGYRFRISPTTSVLISTPSTVWGKASSATLSLNCTFNP